MAWTQYARASSLVAAQEIGGKITAAERVIESLGREHAAAHGEMDAFPRHRLGDPRGVADEQRAVGKGAPAGKIDGIGGAQLIDAIAALEQRLEMRILRQVLGA